MDRYEGDEVDRELLRLLQTDARRPATELAAEVGVSDNTVHNRIDSLEEAGVIRGYTTTLDYGRLGLDRHVLFVCTTPVGDRRDVAEAVRALPGVVEVTELMTGERNLLAKVVGRRDDDVTRVAERLEELGVEIHDQTLVRAEHGEPLDPHAPEAERGPRA
jgi:DNA-binding Lrp family transcriptional regulator